MAASAAQRLLSADRHLCMFPRGSGLSSLLGAYKLKIDVSYPHFHFELLSHLEKLQRLNSSITVKCFFSALFLILPSLLLRPKGYLPLEKLAFQNIMEEQFSLCWTI